MTKTVVTVDKSGRLVLPVGARRALGVERGGALVLTLEESGALRLVNPDTALAQVRALIRSRSRGRLLSDELSAERRAAAARE